MLGEGAGLCAVTVEIRNALTMNRNAKRRFMWVAKMRPKLVADEAYANDMPQQISLSELTL